MVSAADESFASSGRETQEDSGRPFPRALLPDTTCPEAALAKANRELRMLIDCKRSLARAQDERQLLTEICRILVGPGGYRLAWFGFADGEPDYGVRVAAHAGHDSGYLERLRVSWRGDEEGPGAHRPRHPRAQSSGMPAYRHRSRLPALAGGGASRGLRLFSGLASPPRERVHRVLSPSMLRAPTPSISPSSRSLRSSRPIWPSA